MLNKIRNIGKIDRTIRFIIAVIAAGAAVIPLLTGYYNPALIITSAIVTGLMVLTASVRICPVYLPFNIKTFNKGENK